MLTNKSFSRLTVINLDKEKTKEKKRKYWNCRCICGNFVSVSQSRLLIGKTKSCGCLHSENLTDKRFGKLLVISKVSKYKPESKATYWKCKCDCGNEKIIERGSLIRGYTTSCGCYRREKRKLPIGVSGRNLVFLGYKKAARRKNLPFILTLADFDALAKSCCYYCGTKPTRVMNRNRQNGVYVWNGLDRVDNERGYEKDNVVPCCYSCNIAKGILSSHDFKQNIKRLYEYKRPDVIKSNLNLIYDGSSDALYSRYKSDAKKRNKEFFLTKEEFYMLTKEACFYCGAQPNGRHKNRKNIYIYNGLDRVDNKKGYEIGNVVPCCKFCNQAKLTCTLEEFKSWVKRVYEYSC